MTSNDKWGSKWPSSNASESDIPWPLSQDTASVPKNWTNRPDTQITGNQEDRPVCPQQLIDEAKREEKEYTDTYGTEPNPVALGIMPLPPSYGSNLRLIAHADKIIKSQGSNLVDSEAYLYFQCESCNEILDPHTKSFATLQEHRGKAGWKCVWNMSGMGYKVYCVKCGEKL